MPLRAADFESAAYAIPPLRAAHQCTAGAHTSPRCRHAGRIVRAMADLPAAGVHRAASSAVAGGTGFLRRLVGLALPSHWRSSLGAYLREPGRGARRAVSSPSSPPNYADMVGYAVAFSGPRRRRSTSSPARSSSRGRRRRRLAPTMDQALGAVLGGVEAVLHHLGCDRHPRHVLRDGAGRSARYPGLGVPHDGQRRARRFDDRRFLIKTTVPFVLAAPRSAPAEGRQLRRPDRDPGPERRARLPLPKPTR